MRTLSAVLLALCLSLAMSVADAATISVSQFVEHPALDAVYQGLEDYFTDHQIEVEFKRHNAQANMATAGQIATQMIGEDADLLVAIATPAAQACAQALDKAPAERKRPLLFTAVTDPLAAGLVKDLEHPGGLITGVSDLLPVEEHLRMVLEYQPTIKKLGLLYNAGEANSKATVATIRGLSAGLGITVVEATAAKTADVYQAAKSLVGRVDAIFIPTDNTIISALENVLKVGIQNRVPVFAADVDSVERGAVAAMGFDYYRHGYQTGAMAAKILAGEDPGTIPVEFQSDLELHINQTYSEKIGLTPPKAMLERATKVYH